MSTAGQVGDPIGASRATRQPALSTALAMILAAVLFLPCVARGEAASGPAGAPASPQAMRIVSFAPSFTQILFAMGLGEQVVGVTRFCQLPPGVYRPRIGDAFDISAEAVLKVRPDVIFVQTSAGKFQGVRQLDPHVQIVEMGLERLTDVPKVLSRIGEVTGRQDLAEAATTIFQAKLQAVRQRVAGLPRPRTMFVMGTDRPVAAGGGNFIGDLIEVAGGINAGADIPGLTRWRPTHIDAIAAASPDVLICQADAESQAASARKYWLQWGELPAAKNGRVHVVSAPEWSIPGTHLADLASVMAATIHPPPGAAGLQAEINAQTLRRAWMLRLLAAAVVGAALAAAGMALQGLLRNPLAEPYILGVSSGAGVGVLLGLALAAWWAMPSWASTPVLAFAGALVTCAAVYGLARRRGRLDPYALILAGVIVNTFNGAIMLTIYLYVDPHRIADFAHWAMGRLPDAVDERLLIVCGSLVAAGWAVLLLHGAAFNVLGLGEAVASSSGVVVGRLRIVTFLCVGLMTAAAVALAGPIGFLGLIVPHLVRMALGPDHRLGLVASGLAGAAILAGAEVLCRTAGPLVGVSLIPVGILTALAGGPFFLYLLRTRFRETTE